MMTCLGTLAVYLDPANRRGYLGTVETIANGYHGVTPDGAVPVTHCWGETSEAVRACLIEAAVGIGETA